MRIQDENKKALVVIALCGVAIIVSLTFAGLALFFRFQATSQARRENTRVWHAVICNIEGAVVSSKQRTPAEKAYEIKFYDKLLVNDVHSTGCGLQEAKP